MDQSTIAVRYAKAFFSSAKDKEVLMSAKSDMETILSLCKQSEDFIRLIESPVIRTTQKEAVMKEIFGKNIQELSMKFLFLITKNKRETDIPAICRKVLSLIREDQNVKSAIITTAESIPEETSEKIRILMEEALSCTIELESKVDNTLIGGLVLRFEDKQYDASVASQLKKIKAKLLETEIR